MSNALSLSIAHETRYAFSEPTDYGLYQVRLTPNTCAVQTVVDWTLEIDGGKAEAQFVDQHRNRVTLVNVERGSSAILVRARGVVDTFDRAGIVGSTQGDGPLWLYLRQTPRTAPGAAMDDLIQAHRNTVSPRSDVSALHALSENILERATYHAGRTDAGTTAEEALAAGHGVCQDHTHIFIGACRALGLPARYVSGYLLMEEREDQEAGHAWAEAYVDGLGWVAFDVSNRISPDARYVRVAVGLDYAEAAPIKGVVLGPADSALTVALQVQQ
jgi:transglutaminase-like putative cysteine protease